MELSNESKQKIIGFIVKENESLNPKEILPNHSLKNDLGLSSLDVVEIAMQIEKVFKVSFLDNDIISASTVKDLFTMTEKYIESKNKRIEKIFQGNDCRN